jgi:hemerythrin
MARAMSVYEFTEIYFSHEQRLMEQIEFTDIERHLTQHEGQACRTWQRPPQ